jgi:hypothetical protein
MQVASFKVGTCRLGGKAHRKRKDSRAHQEAIEVFGEVKPPWRLCLPLVSGAKDILILSEHVMPK